MAETAVVEPKPNATELAIKSIVAEGNIRELDKATPEFKELCASVVSQGIIEPLVVRPRKDGTYALVAGFRRLAAAKEAKLVSVPVRVMDLDDAAVAEVRLLENLQRKDLSPMEEARAIGAYLTAYPDVNKSELAKKIGKSPSWVSERLGLAKLSEPVQKLVETGKLAASHAEVLAQLPDSPEGHAAQERFAREAVQWRTPVVELNRQVKNEVDSIRVRKEFAEAVAKAPFPECMYPHDDRHGTPIACGAKAAGPAPSWAGKGLFQCGKGHFWNPQTGKAKVEPKQPTSGGHGGAMAQGAVDKYEAERAKKAAETRKENEENLAESPVIRSYHPTFGILSSLLKELGPDRIYRVTVKAADEYGDPEDGGTIHIRLTKGPGPFGLSPAKGGTVVLFNAPYTTGHKTGVVTAEIEASERQRLKKAVAAWEKANLSAVKPPKASAPALTDAEIQKVLDGPLDEVLPRLEGFSLDDQPDADREKLELLRDAEVEGKGRGGVLEFIDSELGTSRNPRYD